MIRIALAIAVLLATPLRAAAAEEARGSGDRMVEVMAEIRADDWAAAFADAGRIGRVAVDIVEWRRLRAGLGDFAQYRGFLSRRADWPGLARIRLQGESTIRAWTPPAEVAAYFDGRAPGTGAGALALVRAWRERGQGGDAAAQAVLTWRTQPLSDQVRRALRALYPDLLAPHDVARIDAMIWQGHYASARDMLAVVPDGWEALLAARRALHTDTPGVDDRIAAVPAALADDPGLAFERFAWRARRGRTEDAVALLLSRSGSAEALGRPARWAAWRRVLARRLMRAGEARRAYRVAASNFLTEGADFADLEWLSGYIALRLLGEPETALPHFDRFAAAVETPISRGRAGYWRGRALEAAGRREAAEAAYTEGAGYQTSFYGQLAAERAGVAMDPALVAPGEVPAAAKAQVAGSSVLAAARLFIAAGERNLAERFLTHLAAGLDRPGQRALAAEARDLGEPHLALMIAKEAAKRGHVLPGAYFPVTGLAERDWPVPAALALSVARRESEFDARVVSPIGARGLMQVMPATARAMAGEVGVAYSAGRLLADPAYNARLATAYLAQLVQMYGSSPVLVAAAYNAGPSRVHAWVAARGDPRSAGVDAVDWIEMIPFRETRNYVMRVAESLTVYRARLSGEAQPMRLSEDLAGR